MRFVRLIFLLGGLFSASPSMAALSWHGCPESYGDSPSLSCAKLRVPLDYQHPQQTIDLELARYNNTPAVTKPIVLINAGGPWVDANDGLLDFAASMDKRLTDKYTLISLNPRGSGDTSLLCKTAENQALMQLDLSQDSQREKYLKLALKQQKACDKQLPALAQHVNLNSVVADVETLRQALGVNKLSLLMYSYGARLGAYYLQAYPQHLARMILDSPVYFDDNYMPLVVTQAHAYETSLQRFFQLCRQSKACAIHDAPQQSFQRALSLASDGIPCKGDYHGRRLSRAMFLKVIEKVLPSIDYAGDDNPVSSWAYVADAIYEIDHDYDASMMMQAYINLSGYDVSSNRLTDVSNQVENNALCLDYPYRPNMNSVLSVIRAAAKRDPLIGVNLATMNSANCLNYHQSYIPMLPLDLSHNKVPVLIISSASDPQAPRDWALQDHKAIAHSQLLLWQGVGHGVFNDNAAQNHCVNQAVVSFMNADKISSKTKTCPMEVSLFHQV